MYDLRCDPLGDFSIRWFLSAYLKQRIVQLYFQRRVYYDVLAQVLATEGFRVLKKAVWVTIKKYKEHGTISCLPGSGRPFKLTRMMLDIIETQMELVDETTATQLIRILEERGYKVSEYHRKSKKNTGVDLPR